MFLDVISFRKVSYKIKVYGFWTVLLVYVGRILLTSIAIPFIIIHAILDIIVQGMEQVGIFIYNSLEKFFEPFCAKVREKGLKATYQTEQKEYGCLCTMSIDKLILI